MQVLCKVDNETRFEQSKDNSFDWKMANLKLVSYDRRRKEVIVETVGDAKYEFVPDYYMGLIKIKEILKDAKT